MWNGFFHDEDDDDENDDDGDRLLLRNGSPKKGIKPLFQLGPLP